MLYSLIDTAKANGLTPFDYLNYLLEELPTKSQDIEQLLPWNVGLQKNMLVCERISGASVWGCPAVYNPDTNVGGNITAVSEVFNDKTASIFLDRI